MWSWKVCSVSGDLNLTAYSTTTSVDLKMCGISEDLCLFNLIIHNYLCGPGKCVILVGTLLPV